MLLSSVILDINTTSLDAAYTYAVPFGCEDVRVGCAVLVEFGRRRAIGYVIDVYDGDAPEGLNEVKPLLAVLTEPYFDGGRVPLIRFLADEYVAPLSSCIHLFTPIGRSPKVVNEEGEWRLKLPARRKKQKTDARSVDSAPSCPLELNEDQARALSAICGSLASDQGHSIVLDGVTGSGKTEVYLQAIAECLEQGMGAIVLVPEISLTPQTVKRFTARFGSRVAVMHSGLTPAKRYDVWQSVRTGECDVVVGARSALFAPVGNLGMVVIDEEHESTYKQESAPRYHTRDVAAWMMRTYGLTLVLGSATPSIESLYLCAKDPSWTRAPLPDRANGGALPPIKVVDMSREFKGGGKSMFSNVLSRELLRTVEEGRKAVLLLNKRGFADFLLCRECGYVPECPSCSVSMTYHDDRKALLCHHCGRIIPVPPKCPKCGSPYLKLFGAGTQRVEAELQSLLEGTPARIIRMDSDTTAKRGAHEALLEEFAAEGPAVLLGTQMIAKGLDFPDVTLAAIINADTTLNLPDFRSPERAFDLIEQVAGRAGRAQLPGQVILQTYDPSAYAIRMAASYDRAGFLKTELPKRRALGYPPYTRLANIIIWAYDQQLVIQEAQNLYEALTEQAAANPLEGLAIFPPSPCGISKSNNKFRWHVLLKAAPASDLPSFVSATLRKRRRSRDVSIACDMDPNSLL